MSEYCPRCEEGDPDEDTVVWDRRCALVVLGALAIEQAKEAHRRP